uniref:Uncharacterized protein n=1 Tax=Picea sitchensis TaxID=3332 RepID=C0PQF7_PICSI|nr:unknown [Picea sitchensis]ACN40460.1 unknown [Picea sitchensis]ACN40527.1 unknown [Picea sitchensis]
MCSLDSECCRLDLTETPPLIKSSLSYCEDSAVPLRIGA